MEVGGFSYACEKSWLLERYVKMAWLLGEHFTMQQHLFYVIISWKFIYCVIIIVYYNEKLKFYYPVTQKSNNFIGEIEPVFFLGVGCDTWVR